MSRNPCRVYDAVRVLGQELGASVAVAARELHEGLNHDNPFGLVLVVYCRDCDCTHATHFEPDGPLGSSVSRAAHALRVASTTVRINNDRGETHVSQEDQSSPKTSN